MANYRVGTIDVGFNARNVNNTIKNIDSLILKLQELSKIENSVKSSFNEVSTSNKNINSVKTLTSETKKLSTESEKVKNNFQNMFTIGKIYWFINYFKRFFYVFGDIVAASADFQETLNKFEVSFSTMTDEAVRFANEMTYAFNLSKQSVMDYMSTFNSMLKGLDGLTDAQASSLAQTVTQLSLDYSSLFNVGVDSAMTAFQSVLSGQIKTIRSVSGIDVSEQSLFSYYEDLGGTKSVRQLDQLEKRLLRIYAVQKQMEELGAFVVNEESGEFLGDLEKTINSTSNQLKQISETVQELYLYLGDILRQFFNPVIEKSLSLLLVLKEIAKTYATINELITTSFNEGGYIGSAEDEITSASEALDDFTNQLSFDKFEVIGDNTSSNTSELERILSAINEYNNTFSNIESNARKTANNILKWLGYFTQIDEETGDTLWILQEDSYTNIEKIIDIIELFAIALAVKGVNALVKFTASIKTTALTTQQWNNIMITGAIFTLYNLIQAIQDGDTGLIILNGTILGLIITVSIFRLALQRKIVTMTAGQTTVATYRAALILLGTTIKNVIISLGAFAKQLLVGTLNAIKSAITGIGSLIAANISLIASLGAVAIISGTAFYLFTNMDSYSQGTRTLIGVIAALVAVLSAAAIAALALQGALTFGVAVPLITAAVAGGAVAVKALVSSIDANDIPQYATGAYNIDKGQMFIAREKGPELVGNIGNKSTVANNDQIVSGISQGVYEAVVRANADGGGQNITLNLSGYGDSALARLLSKPLREEWEREGYKFNKV